MCIWGILKAHMVMASYASHEFHDHPSLASIQIQFLVKCKMELDDLVDVSNKIVALQNKYNSLHQVTDGLKCNLKNKQDKN